MRKKKAPPKDSGEKSGKQTDSSVANAMQGLEEMEENFRRDIKRRKMQLLESSVKTSADHNDGIRSKPVVNETQIIKSSGANQQAPDEDEPADNGPWDMAFNEEADLHGELVEGADATGKRAPAVNSDVLPLPWKGRLGYVGHPFAFPLGVQLQSHALLTDI